MQLHKCGDSQDQGQRADRPHRNCQFERARYRMETQPGGDKGKHSACHKWQRTGQSNRSTLFTLTPDFRVGVTSMNPIACEEPVSERRDNTSANNYRNEPRPIHVCLLNMQGLYSCEGPSRIVGVDRVKGRITATVAKSRFHSKPKMEPMASPLAANRCRLAVRQVEPAASSVSSSYCT